MRTRYPDILEFVCGTGDLPDHLARIRVDQTIDRHVAMKVFLLLAEHKDEVEKTAKVTAAKEAEALAALDEVLTPEPGLATPDPLWRGRRYHRQQKATPTVTERTRLRRALRRQTQADRDRVLNGRQLLNLSEAQLKKCLVELGVNPEV